LINVDIAYVYGKAAKHNYCEYSPVKVDKKMWMWQPLKRILKRKSFSPIDNNLIKLINKLYI
jgi:hypothetical protein